MLQTLAHVGLYRCIIGVDRADHLAVPIQQFGLAVEQVEKVNPDLVARDDEGKPYTVRYEAVNATLLNEFLKEHRKVAPDLNSIDQ